MSSSPVYVGTIKTPATSFVNADGIAFKTVCIPGANGIRIDSLIASNSDAANAYVVQLAIQASGVDYPIGEVAIPIGAGTNGVAKSVALLNPTDIPALAYTENGALYLQAGMLLRAKCKTAVSGANVVYVIAASAGDI